MAQDEDICVEVEVRKNDPKVKKFTLEMMIDSISESRIGSFNSKVHEVPEKDSFIVRLDLKNHNLAKGKYFLNFNIGLKTDEYGFMDYDVVYNTILLEVKYNNRELRKPIVLWREEWGKCNFLDGKIEIL
jgi:lipopolysaccharide transport system ATP-binding protein